MTSPKTPSFSGIRPGEAPKVIDILNHCGLPTEDITPALLKDFLVARKGDAIIGVAGIEISGRDALLRSLAVIKGSRGTGIGLKLVLSAERYARSRNVKSLYLLTLTAEAFFRKAEYSAIDRGSVPAAMQATCEFKTLCPATAACMQKEITH